MTGLIAFHLVMVLLALGIATRVVPGKIMGDALGYLHTTIGITTPRPEQVKMIALIWLGATVVIVDGCVLLLLVIATALR